MPCGRSGAEVMPVLRRDGEVLSEGRSADKADLLVVCLLADVSCRTAKAAVYCPAVSIARGRRDRCCLREWTKMEIHSIALKICIKISI